jgi:hypothetical protein
MYALLGAVRIRTRESYDAVDDKLKLVLQIWVRRNGWPTWHSSHCALVTKGLGTGTNMLESALS